MLLLHHTHNRQRDEDEDGATCIAMRQYEKDDEWIWLVMSISTSILLTDDTRTQNKLTSAALDRVALATIQATADNTNFMVDKVVYYSTQWKLWVLARDELSWNLSHLSTQDYELVSYECWGIFFYCNTNRWHSKTINLLLKRCLYFSQELP